MTKFDDDEDGEEPSISDRMAYDVYRRLSEPAERMAVRPGTALPAHVNPADWELMRRGSSQIIDGAKEDITARGFCFFKLV